MRIQFTHHYYCNHAPAGRFPGGGGGCSDKGGRGGNAYKGAGILLLAQSGWQNAGGDSSAQNAGAGLQVVSAAEAAEPTATSVPAAAAAGLVT